MLTYILKRIVLFIPTLIIISLLAFIISVNAPGDPVERMLNKSSGSGDQNSSVQNLSAQKKLWTHKLGLDLPLFYLSLSNAATPDTLYRIYEADERLSLKHMIAEYGNWPQISAYHNAVQDFYSDQNTVAVDSSVFAVYGRNAVTDALNQSKYLAVSLLSASEPNAIFSKFNELQNLYAQYPFFEKQQNELKQLNTLYNRISAESTKWKNYIPALHFYGNNQYHRWIFGDGNWLTGKGSVYSRGIIRGDFGLSYQTQLPIQDVIRNSLPWSLSFTLISVLLAYMISLPLGIRAAARKNSLFDRTSSVILFILYSIPAFWFATLLLMTFANPDILKLFPASGVQPLTGIPEGTSFFERIRLIFPYMVLPTICYTYAQLAFLSRITRVSTLEIISQDYIRTARAKGLSENKVIYKHVLRNTLLPIITVFSSIFPLAIGGSVILESIFTIPGMGKEIFLAIGAKDYPMIITVFTITGVLTLAGYLIADILYVIADPRISYTKKNSG